MGRPITWEVDDPFHLRRKPPQHFLFCLARDELQPQREPIVSEGRRQRQG